LIVVEKHPNKVFWFLDVGRNPKLEFNIDSRIVYQVNVAFDLTLFS
jgi:hypothetical protein